jgi:DNA polymerase III subunit delta'
MELDSIVGHERPRSLLSSLFTKNRYPHALLFSGPPGVGKYTTAFEIVKYLFCETAGACGFCRPCQNVIRDTHPDLHIIRSETSIGIDDLRSVRKEVYEAPFEAPLRIILIDGAEQMTREAANALLKTLEEPPPLNLFLLVTSSEKDLPLTIRSRCMRIGFGPVSTRAVKAHLLRTFHLPEKRAELLASLSWGSMGSAFFWMDEDNFSMRRRLAEFLLGKKRGFVTATALAEIVTSNEKALRFYLYFLLSLFRDLWVIKHAGDARNLVNGDLGELLETNRWDRSRIEHSIRNTQEVLETLRYNVSRWLAFEHLLLSISG